MPSQRNEDGRNEVLLSTERCYALAGPHGYGGGDEPQDGGVDRVPQRFLRGGYARRAENDERACGAGVKKVGKQEAFCVGVNPGNENAYGGHGGSEGKKKRETVGAVGSRRYPVNDNRGVPGAPEQT